MNLPPLNEGLQPIARQRLVCANVWRIDEGAEFPDHPKTSAIRQVERGYEAVTEGVRGIWFEAISTG